MCWELIFNKAGAIRGLFVHVGIIISLIIIFIEFHNGHRHHTETARVCVIQLLHLDVFRISAESQAGDLEVRARGRLCVIFSF